MTPEEAIQVADELLLTHAHNPLTDIQRMILRESLAGKSYEHMEGYATQHIKNEGKQLWDFLSQALGEKVSKPSFKGALEKRWQLGELGSSELSRKNVNDKNEQSVRLANAKAFESGRVLMGTYMELLRDEKYDFKDILERVSVYLMDIGANSVNLDFMKSGMTPEDLREGLNSINNQLWGKGGKLGHYFEIALHLFAAMIPNESERFYQLVGEIDLPTGVVKEEKSTFENFAEIRYYFEGIIFS
jgi:hypothetical protein